MSTALDRRAREAFESLSRDEQREAIHRLRTQGYSDHGIAAATRLSVEQVREIIAERRAQG